ncbi:hypothetical protein [Deinococcus metallilatus]|uniref:Uncharacterized protein n=1 Tax=Deinococcus metallilatus TaxID=1211322 RepID=A0ABR6MNN8_9DEIO|nr:hypothetical protein [Deinococcus metallilatus]MBB5293549.1 hypothetical protein [Deinococcus metallilatus]
MKPGLRNHLHALSTRTRVNLNPEERRRRAVAAIAKQEVTTLLDLL